MNEEYFLGLIGNPVEHSKSPIIHSTISNEYNDGYNYQLYCIEKDDLGNFVKESFDLGMKGFNVTVPYKQDVMEYIVDIDERAKKIGAVNTLVRVSGGYKGYNSDAPGLARALKYDVVEIKDKSVVIVGAGGVSRAVLDVCINGGVKRIVILNRSKDKALALKDEISREYEYDHIEVYGYEDDYMKTIETDKWIAFQCTSVGMFPKVVFSPIENNDFYKYMEVGYDIIFNPLETLFMKKVKEAGGRAFNGLNMLIFQAVISYEHWSEHEVSDEVTKKVISVLADNV